MSRPAQRYIVRTLEYFCRRCGRVQTIPSAQAPAAVHCCDPDTWIYALPGPLEGEADAA